MGSTLLLLAALQLPQPPVPQTSPPRPRFSLGMHVAGMAVKGGEGGGAAFAGGIATSVPIGARTAIDMRLTRPLGSDGFVVWDARWHRLLDTTTGLRPFFAAGLAGVAYKEVRYSGNVRREDWELWVPPMLSLAAGWEAPAGRRFTVPLEAGVMLHPYGLIMGTVSIGVNWGPAPARSGR